MDASRPVPTLRATTVRTLGETFALQGHRPSAAMWAGIEALAGCLEDMAEGTSAPRFYLSSLDPGVGKTQTVIHFIRALSASPLHNHVGVIVFMFTKAQIREVIDELGLHRSEYAVLTKEADLNELGSDDPDSARIIFTTQQRLEKVCTGRSFSEARRFYYLGAPRQVRVWDESLLPANPVVINVHDLGALHRWLKRVSPDLIPELEELGAQLKDAKDRTQIDVPDLSHRLSLRQLQQEIGDREDDLKLAADLWSLFGRKASVRQDGQFGGTMVSIRDGVPLDLAPLVILDASGRVRTAYEWWATHRKNLVKLTPAVKRYDRLTIHVWNTGGGRWTFRDLDRRNRLRQGIVSTIRSKSSSEQWLIVCHKAYRDVLEREIAGEVEAAAQRIHFLHWGVHRATNEYRHVTNVILAGTQFYARSGYEATGRAASGLLPEQGALTEQQEREIEMGEHAHLILQAVCRGAARKAEDDECPPCHVYLVASRRHGISEVLRTLFRGCQIEPWEPVPRKLSGKAGEAARFVVEWIDQHPGELLTFKTVVQGVGMTDRHNFNRSIRKHSGFKEALADADIGEVRLGAQRGFLRQEFDQPSMSPEDYFPTEEPTA